VDIKLWTKFAIGGNLPRFCSCSVVPIFRQLHFIFPYCKKKLGSLAVRESLAIFTDEQITNLFFVLFLTLF
jgi:hypothetical protein